MTNAPDDIDAVLHDLGRALDLIVVKDPDYRTAKEYYDGDRAEVSANKVIEAILETSAKAHPISLAHIAVDAVVDKVELSALTATEKVAADKLTQWYDDNDLEDEADDWHRKAGYFGDYYVIVDPRDEDARGAATTVRTAGSSPLTTIVMYSREDSTMAEYGVKRWKASGGRWRANVYYDDCTILLVTEKSKSDAPKAEDFYPLLENDEPGSERVPHLGGRMLVVHYAVDGKPYGQPLHRKAFGPQDAITKVSATNLAAVDGQGFPYRWALADPLAAIDDDIDDDFGDNGPTSVVNGNDDGRSNATVPTGRVRTLPGSIALLRGIKDVGQFDSADTDNFLKNIEFYIRVMAVACGVPLFEFDLNGEQPSGEARRRAEGRINKHARKIMRSLSRAHTTLGDTVLGVMGMTAAVAVSFRPTETETDKDGLELVALKIKTGVPVRQAFREAGYTEEQVLEWFPNNAPHMTPDLITILAGALNQLGTAKTLGVITDVELADMLPDILTAARNEGLAPLPGIVTAIPQVDADAA